MTELNYENYEKDLSYIWQNTPKNKKKKKLRKKDSPPQSK